MKTIINLRGHKWYMCPEKSELGENYVTLERVSYLSDLKKYGQVATKIDVHINELYNYNSKIVEVGYEI
jgi:hypothetical protein